MITDLLSLTAFFEQIATGTEGIAVFLPLSNAEKAVDEISAYYNDNYGGTTAFFQVAEMHRKNNHSGLEQLTFFCSLTVAEKPEDTSARAGLQTRDRTMKVLLSMLGTIQLQADASADTVEPGVSAYEFTIEPSERIFPIGMLANVNLEGHYLDIDVKISANHLLYS
ncbi:hypothetical protein [Spirosoma agri]|uniref:Uncharacterized protein n=1 Tax=Spirosoma agri TaxID=1987381 RepID=A0A6M0IFY4_9BACT|nr:hypothetical protein [Spirosoma agri]NEU67058.1 hypothetical protein [Spirosoma agri]